MRKNKFVSLARVLIHTLIDLEMADFNEAWILTDNVFEEILREIGIALNSGT
jgi:hypothetical protein